MNRDARRKLEIILRFATYYLLFTLYVRIL